MANRYKKNPIKRAVFIFRSFKNGYKNKMPEIQAERNHIALGG